MTSEKQMIANRENSKKSTGPVTDGGKAISSMNAITNGEYMTRFDRISGEHAGNLKPCKMCSEEQKT